MEREHRKRGDQGDGRAAAPERQQAGTKPGAGGRDDRAPHQDDDREQENDEGDDEESGSRPVAQASRAEGSREDLEDNIKDAWMAVKENEKSIVRGMYGRLEEKPQKRNAGFLSTLFTDLTSAGVTHLLSKIHPGAAVGIALNSVFNAAKSAIANRLPAKDDARKVDASEFLEIYVREHVNAGWLKGADRLEIKMNEFGRPGLKALRKHMRALASESSREGATLTDSVLNSWMHMLNQEHKQETGAKDFDTETSGRLHLEGVNIISPPELRPEDPYEERFHGLTAWLDGTGTLRNRLLVRRLDALKVPLSVAGAVSRHGTFSFAVGSNSVPIGGPTNGGDLGLQFYAKSKDPMEGVRKLWSKMRNHTLGDLVGNNKPGGKSEDVQGSKDD